MLMPSLRRSPAAPVLLALSLPARSTKWNLDTITSPPDPPSAPDVAPSLADASPVWADDPLPNSTLYESGFRV